MKTVSTRLITMFMTTVMFALNTLLLRGEQDYQARLANIKIREFFLLVEDEMENIDSLHSTTGGASDS